MIFMEKDKIVLKQNDVQNAFDIFKILNNNTLDVFGQYVIQENDIIFTKNFRSVPVFEYPLRIDAYILVLCLNGSIDLDINLKLYHLVPNMAVILEPNSWCFTIIITLMTLMPSVASFRRVLSPTWLPDFLCCGCKIRY